MFRQTAVAVGHVNLNTILCFNIFYIFLYCFSQRPTSSVRYNSGPLTKDGRDVRVFSVFGNNIVHTFTFMFSERYANVNRFRFRAISVFVLQYDVYFYNFFFCVVITVSYS